jgi:hypothetical protein
LREEMLDSGAAREEVLEAQDLGAVRLAVGNALRGMVEAVLVAPPELPGTLESREGPGAPG